MNRFPTKQVYIRRNVFSRKQSCFIEKTNGLIQLYKVVVAKHLMDILRWPSWTLIGKIFYKCETS